MKIEELMPPLRDLPAGRLELRKQHLLAEVSRDRDSAARGLGYVRRPKFLGTALAMAVVTGATLAAVSTLSGAHAAAQKYTAVPAANVAEVVSQVQQSFGDGVIQSASVSGSAVTVDLANRQLDSPTVGGFEAAILGHAIADWQGAHGDKPATQLNLIQVDANGTTGAAQGESIGSDTSATPLASGACEAAAQDLPTSIVVVSAQTLPYAGGTCVYKVETAGDPDAAARAVREAMSNAIAGAYPSLVEVDDLNGVPQIVLTGVPGINGEGQGRLFVRPGLTSSLNSP